MIVNNIIGVGFVLMEKHEDEGSGGTALVAIAAQRAPNPCQNW